MAVQSSVTCSEVKDGALLVSWQLMKGVLVWVASSNLAVEDGFLSIMDTSFEYLTIPMPATCFPIQQDVCLERIIVPMDTNTYRSEKTNDLEI